MKVKRRSGTVNSGVFKLNYTIEGQGRPALVIGSSLYYPRTFSKDLRSHLKLVFADHRGFAPHTNEVDISEYNLDTVLADIELIREHLGLTNFVMIGHSGHGYIALEYAKRYPQHVSHIVMIATGPSHSEAHMQLAQQHWQEAVCPARKKQLDTDLMQLPDALEAAPDRRFITVCLKLGAKSWFDHEFDAAPLWQGVQVNMQMFDYVWGEIFRNIDITKNLNSLDKPVLLALGRFDYLVAPYASWTPYRPHFRDLTVRVFDRSSHTPQFEESRHFDEMLLDWLRLKT